jgi:hypothetical protein
VSSFPRTPRNRVARLPDRASYDRDPRAQVVWAAASGREWAALARRTSSRRASV